MNKYELALEKRVLRELGINVSFQVMIFLITWVLYLIFGTAVVAYAKLVKTPSTTSFVSGRISSTNTRCPIGRPSPRRCPTV